MHTAEIVVSEMQCDSGFQVRQLLLNALVSRVNLRIAIRIVRFCRSTNKVMICSGSGSRSRTLDNTPKCMVGVPRIGTVELPKVTKHFGSVLTL